MLISGEAGVGKSSLVEELPSGVPEADWLWGACDGLFTPRPLAPVHDLARQVGGDLAGLVAQQAPRDRIFDAMLRHLSDAGGFTVLVVEAPSPEAANTVHREAHGLVADEVHEVREGS